MIKIEIGTKYNHLTAQKFLYRDKLSNQIWLWECDCKNKTQKELSLNSVKQGNTKSCGCLKLKRTQQMGKDNYKHGLSATRLYNIWRGMKLRCLVKNEINYKDYGGRGIKICDEWKDNFISFKEWALTNGYKDNLTIDRIDVNGNYCPENCRFITNLKQQNNRRNNRFYTFNNKTQTISEWSRELNIEKSVLRNRIIKNNNILDISCLK